MLRMLIQHGQGNEEGRCVLNEEWIRAHCYSLIEQRLTAIEEMLAKKMVGPERNSPLPTNKTTDMGVVVAIADEDLGKIPDKGWQQFYALMVKHLEMLESITATTEIIIALQIWKELFTNLRETHFHRQAVSKGR